MPRLWSIMSRSGMATSWLFPMFRSGLGRSHRPARPQWRGQVHDAEDDGRAAGAFKSGRSRSTELLPAVTPMAYRNLGLVSEHEVIYPFMSGREFVRLNAKLQRVAGRERR